MNHLPSFLETAQAARRALKEERMAFVRQATQLAKHQNACIRKITTAMAAGPCTVPEIAAATAIPAPDVLRFVMTLKKYGSVVEGTKDDGYYRYALSEAPTDVKESREAA
jgi:hypothetical protein